MISVLESTIFVVFYKINSLLDFLPNGFVVRKKVKTLILR
jgi:hypothetical protein